MLGHPDRSSHRCIGRRTAIRRDFDHFGGVEQVQVSSWRGGGESQEAPIGLDEYQTKGGVSPVRGRAHPPRRGGRYAIRTKRERKPPAKGVPSASTSKHWRPKKKTSKVIFEFEGGEKVELTLDRGKRAGKLLLPRRGWITIA